MTKVLITGSHFTPAQALIRELKKYPKISVFYIGRGTTMERDKTLSVESRVLPNLGVHFMPIVSGRVQKFSPVAFLSLAKIPVGFIQSLVLVIKVQPDVIISFGGYTSVPVVIAAWLLSIPIIVHQQTLVTSLSGWIENIFADKIALSFPKAQLDNKEIVTGNPVRGELINSSTKLHDIRVYDFLESCRKERGNLLLVTGGNQGSHIINQVILDLLPMINQKYWVIHQTGDSKFQDFELLQAEGKKLNHPNRYLALKWIEVEDWAKILEDSKFAVSRGGINTLLELMLFKVPSIVIPIPHLPNNEQEINAQYFAKAGWVKILPQSELSTQRLFSEVENLAGELALVGKRFQGDEFKRISDLVVDADKRLALEVLLLIHKREGGLAS